ncbi:hypothetical protein [Actinopolymorpha pittospori]
MPAPVPLPAELRLRPFRIEEARRLGLSVEVLRGRRFRRIYRGVYACAELPDTLTLRAVAARLLVPHAVLSHVTAAALRDLPVPVDCRVHLTLPPPIRGPQIAGIVAHKGALNGVTTFRGLPLTDPAQTFLDLGRGLGLVDTVILGDAIVRRGFAELSELAVAARSVRGRGARNVSRAIALVRARVDSPMETRLRLLCVLAGLPEPEPGAEVHDEHGQWIATTDLRYDEERIALEYDGDLHRTSKRKWRHDVAAREELRARGWIVLAVTADDIFVRPHRTLARIHDALVARRHPAVPITLDPAWRDYFPGRGYLSDEW